MKIIIAVSVLFVLLIALYISNTTLSEGFETSTYDILSKPLVRQPLTPEVAQLGIGTIEASPPPPGSIPSAPIDQRSKLVPLPYSDPSKEPAKYIRILAVLYDLQAFFGFQAANLKDTCDPALVLPLQSAKADMAKLQNVQMVLERNPGIPSRIKNNELDEITANLHYLQEAARQVETDKSGYSEGFSNQTQNQADTNSKTRATSSDLKGFNTKVIAEIARLQASGTTDPSIQARINTLQRIKSDIDEILKRIKDGLLRENEIPIFKSDIDKALPILGSTNDPLPTLLEKAGLPAAIASAFPNGLNANDATTANRIERTVNRYMQDLTQGTSWELGVKANIHYDSPRAQEIAKSQNQNQEPAPIMSLLNFTTSQPASTPQTSVRNSVPDPFTVSPSPSTYDPGMPGMGRPELATPRPGGLDWKKRAYDICEQIRMRGLEPLDFACLPTGTEVSPEFSWRGHVQMVCNRLLTTTDPGLPEQCGCPPQNWPGWKL
jgi:hypothetical protein